MWLSELKFDVLDFLPFGLPDSLYLVCILLVLDKLHLVKYFLADALETSQGRPYGLSILGGPLFDLVVQLSHYLLHPMALQLILGNCVRDIVEAVELDLGWTMQVDKRGRFLFWKWCLRKGFLEYG